MRILRSIFITLIGLIVAIFIYPFLHEIGHSIATLLVCGSVTEFVLFPFPYMVSKINEINDFKIIIMGISGMIFPVLFTFIIYSKKFWIWLVGLYLNVICFLSFVISAYACVSYNFSVSITNEDITQIMEITSGGSWLWMTVFLILAVLLIIQIVKSHPLKKCYELK